MQSYSRIVIKLNIILLAKQILSFNIMNINVIMINDKCRYNTIPTQYQITEHQS